MPIYIDSFIHSLGLIVLIKGLVLGVALGVLREDVILIVLDPGHQIVAKDLVLDPMKEGVATRELIRDLDPDHMNEKDDQRSADEATDLVLILEIVDEMNLRLSFFCTCSL